MNISTFTIIILTVTVTVMMRHKASTEMIEKARTAAPTVITVNDGGWFLLPVLHEDKLFIICLK